MNSVLKTVGTVGLVSLVALGVGLWLSDCGGGTDEERREAAEAVERADAQEERAEALREALDAAYAGIVESRRADSARIAELESRIESARERAGAAAEDVLRATDSLEAVLKSLHDAVRPGLRPVVDTALARKDSLDSAHRERVDELEGVIARKDSQFDVVASRLDSVEATLEICRDALGACEATVEEKDVAIEKLEDAADDSFWERLGRSTPEVIGKAGALGAACALPPGDAKIPACAGAASMVIVDLAI